MLYEKDILNARNITKKFGGLKALDNVSFDVKHRDILGIIGPNGAGKSTFLNVISSYYPPTNGTILFEERDITGLKAHEIAKLGIGRNFQNIDLFATLPVIENVFTGFHSTYKTNPLAGLFRLPHALREEAALRKKSEEILLEMGLEAFKNELTKNLPYGHQRILGICVAIATSPKLLLLDEPLTGMNQTEIQEIKNIIKGIHDRGITIILIEHNMEAVMSLCNRIVVLDHGLKIAEGPPALIQNNEQVIEAYLGKE